MSKQQKRTYVLEVKAEMDDLLSKTEAAKKAIEGISLGASSAGIPKSLTQIENKLSALKEKAADKIPLHMFDNLTRDAESVKREIEEVSEKIDSLSKLSDAQKIELLPKDFQKKILDGKKALETYNATVSAAQKNDAKLIASKKNLAEREERLIKLQTDEAAKKAILESAKVQQQADKENLAAINKKVTALQDYLSLLKQQEKASQKKGGQTIDTSAAKSAVKNAGIEGIDVESAGIKEIETALSSLILTQKEYNALLGKSTKDVTSATGAWQKKTREIEAENAAIEGLNLTIAELEKMEKKADPETLEKAFKDLRAEAIKLDKSLEDIGESYTAEGLERIKNALEGFTTSGLNQANASIEMAANSFNKLGFEAQTTAEKIAEVGAAAAETDAKIANRQAFADKIKQFVGLQGAALVARKALSSAMQTIKELDKTMTEMAVVTDLTVGDYWDQLPQYSKQASQLGVSINDAYKAATLYYQQGLKGNEVTKISAQTLKMARIAGLSAADATDKMTAALRGFNMELDETSAQRVADVYSKLAAITAADVNEISSAMSKTASIASSAGMEFETTAAFLSQIIETTRESAETAGTALKTVIARFQELKKDPSEIGEIDGEIVDANKIETALRSVGVALRDSSGQFRDLDDVFLELSSKWDSLDTNTQRYIATIAAGSRQQSRFIAMMSDYSRTQELVLAANTSAGASNEQFEKTMDSLESKLAKLKVAWDEFTMDLMDSDFLKGAVDLLTKILETINSITKEIGGENSGTVKIALIIASLVAADKALTVFRHSMNDGKSVVGSFFSIFTTGAENARTRLEALKESFNQMKNQVAIGADANRIKKGKEAKHTVAKTPAQKEAKGKVDQYSKSLKAQTDAENRLNDAKKKRLEYEEKLKKAEPKSKGGLTAARNKAERVELEALNDVQKNSIQLEKDRTAATEAMATAYGLSNKQSADAVQLMATGNAERAATILGLGQESVSSVAAMAAQGGLTAEKEAEYRAMMIANGMRQEEIDKRMGEITATYAQVGASKVENAEKKTGLALGIQTIKNHLSNAAAKVGETLAQWGLNAALATGIGLTLVYGLALAAILAVVILIISAIQSYKKQQEEIARNKPEKKLEDAKKAAELAAEAANEAAEAYEDLNSAFEELTGKYEHINQLTEGTLEWKNAVREVNAEVTDLISQYPELAALVSAQSGVLTIDFNDEEVKDVLTAYEQRAANARIMALQQNRVVTYRQSLIDYSHFQKRGGLSGYYSRISGESENMPSEKQFIDKIGVALTEGAIQITADGDLKVANEEYIKNLGLTTDWVERFGQGLEENADILKAYGATVKQRQAEETAYKKSIAVEIASKVNTTGMSTQEQNQIQNYLPYNSAIFTEAQKIATEFLDKYKNAGDAEARAKYLDDLVYQYTGKSGVKIETEGLSAYNDTVSVAGGEAIRVEDLVTQLAGVSASEEFVTLAEKLPQAIDTLSQFVGKESAQTQKVFEKMMATGDGTILTEEDIALLVNSGLYEFDDLKKFWEENADKLEPFGSFGNFLDFANDIIIPARQANREVSIKEGLMSVDADDNLSVKTQDAYLTKLNSIYLEKGKDGVRQFNNELQNLTKDLTPEELEKFYSQLMAINWDSVEDWDNFGATLEALGLNLPQEALSRFVDEAKEANTALEKIDLEKLTETIKSVGSLIQNIQNGEVTRVISADEYNALIEHYPEMAEYFSQNLDGSFNYLGETLDGFIEDLRRVLQASLDEGEDQLRAKIAASDIIKVADENGEAGTSRLQNQKTWEKEDKISFVTDVYNALSAGGVDFSSLGVRGFGEETTEFGIKNMTIEELNDTITDIMAIGVDSTQWTKELSVMLKQTNGLLAQTYSFEKNRQSAESLRTSLIESYDIETRLQNNQEYTKASEDLEKAIQEGSTEEIERLEKILAELRKEEGDKIDYQKEVQDRNEMIGLMEAMYSQAISKDVPEEALSMYAYIIDALKNLDPSADNYGALLGLATEFETGIQNLIECGEELEDAMNKFRSNTNYFQMLEGIKSGTDFKIDRLEQQFARAENSDAYSIEDTAQYIVSRFELYSEKADLLGQEQQAWATVMGGQNGEGGLLTPDNPWAKFVLGLDNSGSYVIDYKAAQDYINTFEGTEREVKAEGFNNYLSLFEEFSNSYRNNIQEIEDLLDEIIALQDFGKEEYVSLLERVASAIKKAGEMQIEELQDIGDVISETQQNLIDGIQEQISEQRQQNDNRDSEQELAEKRAQLAYLQADSSGGNALKILELQEEIAEAEEAYQENLVDQAVQQLQDASDRAESQRNRQIQLAEAQLEAYADSQQLWIDAEYLLLDGMATGQDFFDSRAWKLIEVTENVGGQSHLHQQAIREDVRKVSQKAAVWAYLKDAWDNFEQSHSDDVSVSIVTSTNEQIEGLVKSFDTAFFSGENALFSNLDDTKTGLTNIGTAASGAAGAIGENKENGLWSAAAGADGALDGLTSGAGGLSDALTGEDGLNSALGEDGLQGATDDLDTAFGKAEGGANKLGQTTQGAGANAGYFANQMASAGGALYQLAQEIDGTKVEFSFDDSGLKGAMDSLIGTAGNLGTLIGEDSALAKFFSDKVNEDGSFIEGTFADAIDSLLGDTGLLAGYAAELQNPENWTTSLSLSMSANMPDGLWKGLLDKIGVTDTTTTVIGAFEDVIGKIEGITIPDIAAQVQVELSGEDLINAELKYPEGWDDYWKGVAAAIDNLAAVMAAFAAQSIDSIDEGYLAQMQMRVTQESLLKYYSLDKNGNFTDEKLSELYEQYTADYAYLAAKLPEGQNAPAMLTEQEFRDRLVWSSPVSKMEKLQNDTFKALQAAIKNYQIGQEAAAGLGDLTLLEEEVAGLPEALRAALGDYYDEANDLLAAAENDEQKQAILEMLGNFAGLDFWTQEQEKEETGGVHTHEYVDGKCVICGAIDPNYVPPPTPTKTWDLEKDLKRKSGKKEKTGGVKRKGDAIAANRCADKQRENSEDLRALAPDNTETQNDKFVVEIDGEEQTLSKDEARRALLWSLDAADMYQISHLLSVMGGFTAEDVLYFRRKGADGSDEDKARAQTILFAMRDSLSWMKGVGDYSDPETGMVLPGNMKELFGYDPAVMILPVLHEEFFENIPESVPTHSRQKRRAASGPDGALNAPVVLLSLDTTNGTDTSNTSGTQIRDKKLKNQDDSGEEEEENSTYNPNYYTYDEETGEESTTSASDATTPSTEDYIWWYDETTGEMIKVSTQDYHDSLQKEEKEETPNDDGVNYDYQEVRDGLINLVVGGGLTAAFTALLGPGLGKAAATILGAILSAIIMGTDIGDAICGIVRDIFNGVGNVTGWLGKSLAQLANNDWVKKHPFIEKCLTFISDLLIDIARFFTGDENKYLGFHSEDEISEEYTKTENRVKELEEKELKEGLTDKEKLELINAKDELERMEKDGEKYDENEEKKNIIERGAEFLNNAGEKISDAWDATKEFVSDAGEAVVDAVETAGEWIGDTYESAKNWVSNGWNKLWGRSANGSVAHYTGPMWIDGTASAPEMILSPSQTQDMLAVVEYLNSNSGEELGERMPALGRLGKSIPKLKQYKTGGLVSSTGLAWLDGTHKKPEYVLNAEQTEQYLELQKILTERAGAKLTRPKNTPTTKENSSLGWLVQTLANNDLEDLFYEKLQGLWGGLFGKNKKDDKETKYFENNNIYEILLQTGGVVPAISIKNILSDVLQRETEQNEKENAGDNYYDIKINVDKLENDYDVEQLADKIRSMIHEDALFRNVQSLGFSR